MHQVSMHCTGDSFAQHSFLGLTRGADFLLRTLHEPVSVEGCHLLTLAISLCFLHLHADKT
jgi:hypothetical protein